MPKSKHASDNSGISQCFWKERNTKVAADQFPDAAFLSHAASLDMLACSVTGWMQQFKLYPQQLFNWNDFMMAQVQDFLRVLPEDESERNLTSLCRIENNAMNLLHSLERNPVFWGVSWVLSTSLVKQILIGLFRILTKVAFTTYSVALVGKKKQLQ